MTIHILSDRRLQLSPLAAAPAKRVRSIGSYVVDGAVGRFCALPLAWAGRTEEEIFRDWESALAKENPEAAARLRELIDACAAWRIEQDPHSSNAVELKIVFVDSKAEKGQPSALEKSVDDSEERLRAALGEEGWERYSNQARSYVRSGLQGARGIYLWPPSFSTMHARRWICKRAHDLGWTSERFGAFDRTALRADRYDHRLERIGKKYQWLAFHERLARLGDNLAFREDTSGDGISVFQGPWQINRRDIDPSLLAARGQDGWRQPKQIWWMPAGIKLRALSPHARLTWLDSPDGIVSDASIITVTEPKSKRNWLVVSEVAQWYQWTVREGDRDLDQRASFQLRCLLVRAKDRAKLIQDLSGRFIDSLPEIERPFDGYLGEYPWHPVCADLDDWIEPCS